MSCFVPNCKNTSGVPFPRDTNVKKQWIESLKLISSPTPSSFICLDHFKPSDLNNECDTATRPSNKIKRGSIPCVIISKIKNKRNEENTVEFINIKNDDDTRTACRICNTTECLEKNIYDTIDGVGTIMSTIMLCCYPVVITKEDNLPHFICSPCLKQLGDSHKFRLRCLETDELWRRKDNSKKRKLSETSERSRKKICTSDDDSDYDEFDEYEECVEEKCKLGGGSTRSLLKIKEIKEDSNGSESNGEKLLTVQISKDDPPPLVPFNQLPPLIPIDRKNVVQSVTSAQKYDEIEKNLEEIHGVTDTDTERNTERKVKPKLLKVSSNSKAPIGSHTVKVVTKGVDVISIPKGIRVVQTDAFESSRGKFSCTLTHGIHASVFVLANEYLFSLGLLKGNTRYLHCVLPSCQANAEQTLLDDGTYEDYINVKIPHSHPAPTDQVRKKHMFFHVMRKRMQLDKTLNIRSIYEEVCTLEPEIRTLVPLRNVINEICKYQVSNRLPQVTSFEDFFSKIENEAFEKLHFTNTNYQFYQEKFTADDGSLAIVFCNMEIIEQVSDSKIMYVDASFKIDTYEEFKYQLITVLVWIDDSYYPILYALANKKTQEIFKKVFKHLHDVLAPSLRPHEIVTDYEANLYYALGETYLDSHIGGSVFYYTQNLYKKICSLNLSRDLEINSNFRNVYHMLLMLPLLPVNTILDGLNNIEIQARDMGLTELARPIFDHIRTQWILNVTPELFCVHRLENRINENVIAPFKKLRDFLLLFKGRVNQSQITVAQVVEKLIELESFLHGMYTKADKKSFGRDLSSFQKKNVVRAWQFIEAHPKININSFFQKVLGYIKCMENQLWIWGFYRYAGDTDDELINASNFSIVPNDDMEDDGVEPVTEEFIEEDGLADEPDFRTGSISPTIVMEAVIDNDGGVVLQTNEENDSKQFEKAFLKYVQYE